VDGEEVMTAREFLEINVKKERYNQILVTGSIKAYPNENQKLIPSPVRPGEKKDGYAYEE